MKKLLFIGIIFPTICYAQTVDDPMRKACSDYHYAFNNEEICEHVADHPVEITQQIQPNNNELEQIKYLNQRIDHLESMILKLEEHNDTSNKSK